MANELYRDKNWLYHHYVVKRMKITQIQELLLEKHGIKISPQALYNWIKKYDLLKYRGKGRRLKSQHAQKRTVTPMQKRVSEMRKRNKQIKKNRGF